MHYRILSDSHREKNFNHSLISIINTSKKEKEGMKIRIIYRVKIIT